MKYGRVYPCAGNGSTVVEYTDRGIFICEGDDADRGHPRLIGKDAVPDLIAFLLVCNQHYQHCDGDHGSPTCFDPACWHKEPK